MRVLVGMSGGVDSSVSAALLLQEGYDVEGAFMKNWEDDDGTPLCTAKEDFMDAAKVADQLDIKLHHVNFSREYKSKVFDKFIIDLEKGKTPNPDILCNQYIKFNEFYKYAIENQFDCIATGHYAGIKEISGHNCLVRAKDKNKDQTYFLCNINQEVLDKTIFPLSRLTKKEVRNIAKSMNLSTFEKKDSTGICFIGERPFPNFLENYINDKSGKIICDKGNEIGFHRGLSFYTLGQRQGLGIGGLKDYDERPWYVVEKKLLENILVVAQGNDNQKLFEKKLSVNSINWICEPDLTKPIKLEAKIRYRQDDQECILSKEGKTFSVEFKKPQRAITPGQSIVFYQDNICLGGGEIYKS